VKGFTVLYRNMLAFSSEFQIKLIKIILLNFTDGLEISICHSGYYQYSLREIWSQSTFLSDCQISKGIYCQTFKHDYNLNCCFSVYFDKYEILSFQQIHNLLKHKMLQFLFKCLSYIAPTCFGPHGPSSGSTYQNLTTVIISLKLSVKVLR
jgi:hypothetical protein